MPILEQSWIMKKKSQIHNNIYKVLILIKYIINVTNVESDILFNNFTLQ